MGVLCFALLFSFVFRYVYTETNFLNVFFKKSSATRKGFDYVDDHLGGVGGFDLLAQSSEKDTFSKMAAFKHFARWKKELARHSLINSSQSYLEPVSMMHRELSLDSKGKPGRTLFSDGGEREAMYPQSNRQLAQELLFLEFSRNDEDRGVLASYVNFDYSNARFHVQTPNLSSAQLGKLFAFVRELIPEKVDGLRVFLTGDSFYFYKLSQYILSTQFISILFTLFLIWVCFGFYFGFALGTLGMVPNVIPVLFTMGSIPLLKMPYDFATVLIGSVSLGLCVDNSIHFLHYYKMKRGAGLSLKESVNLTLRHLGRPIFFTTVLFSIAFTVFLFSDLVILLKFGLFTLIALFLALLSNVLVLPAFLFWWERGKDDSKRKPQLKGRGKGRGKDSETHCEPSYGEESLPV